MSNLNLNYKFVDKKLYKLALTHKSHSSFENNERLEFLGDAVLDMVVTDFIYKNYPDLSEGELAKLRADTVCSASLTKVATMLGVESELCLGKGEDAKPSILANTMEAIIAAIYLDGGYEVVKGMIIDWFNSQIDEAAKNPGMSDYKSRLQELSVKVLGGAPIYEVASNGPDHSKWFMATVEIDKKQWGKGEGHTKKEATQLAAMEAFNALEEHNRKVATNKK